jgi:hypothetical protein
VTELLIIVPTRSRPDAVARVVGAWRVTGALDEGAQLCFAIDADDPMHAAYLERLLSYPDSESWLHIHTIDVWRPLVPKLNSVAVGYAAAGEHSAIGFAGDDHLPRTSGWVGRYLAALREMRTGIVSCSDGYREDKLPTQWAMTSDIIRALGRMVPAPVDHLYCDNAVRDLGRDAGCLTYLDDVLIEHMNPYANGKAPMDEQYRRVNSREQYRGDRRAYHGWLRSGIAADVATVRALTEQGVSA